MDTAITESSSKPNTDFSGSRVRLLEILLQMQNVPVQEVQTDCHKWELCSPLSAGSGRLHLLGVRQDVLQAPSSLGLFLHLPAVGKLCL